MNFYPPIPPSQYPHRHPGMNRSIHINPDGTFTETYTGDQGIELRYSSAPIKETSVTRLVTDQWNTRWGAERRQHPARAMVNNAPAEMVEQFLSCLRKYNISGDDFFRHGILVERLGDVDICVNEVFMDGQPGETISGRTFRENPRGWLGRGLELVDPGHLQSTWSNSIPACGCRRP